MKKNIEIKLRSSSESEVSKAIEEIRENGNTNMIPVLLDIFKNTNNPALYNQILQLFFDIKSKGAEQYFIDAINDETYQEEQEMLVSVFWQSQLDGTAFLSTFVDLAMKSKYEVAFECLTVVESFVNPGNLNDDELMQQIQVLNEAVYRNNQNKAVLEAMADVLNNYLLGE